jgi:hypothetical protein
MAQVVATVNQILDHLRVMNIEVRPPKNIVLKEEDFGW